LSTCDGNAITQARALGRYALELALVHASPDGAVACFKSLAVSRSSSCTGWVVIWAILSRFHPQGQFWHDAIAGTRLITFTTRAPLKAICPVQPTEPNETPVNPQKGRKGLSRVWHATGYSLAGLRAGWGETAFRQEAIAAMLIPAGLLARRTWLETALLVPAWCMVMVVELLNTAVETAIDRIGPEWHDLSKRAKDMGSAAVLLSLLLCLGIWGAALVHRF
jgi:diacylglycerol kinase (ATP)